MELNAAAFNVAIQLRLQTRAAVDREDWPEIFRLCKLADAAFASLGPAEVRMYLAWSADEIAKAREELQKHDFTEFFGSIFGYPGDA